MPNAFDFAFHKPDGAPLPLSDFRGQALLIANTASECGFAGQYETLQGLWARHRDAGLTVIGLAVAKVFLIDISGLEGLTRVLSLVVLGLSLAALAWLNRWAQTRVSSD